MFVPKVLNASRKNIVFVILSLTRVSGGLIHVDLMDGFNGFNGFNGINQIWGSLIHC